MAFETGLTVELLEHTPNPEETCAVAARLCYSGDHISDLKARVSKTDQRKFLEGIMRSGHHSVLEHASFSFAIEGVSRALLAQITRHRVASFSVQSQRYVSYETGMRFIVPPKIRALGQEAADKFYKQMQQMEDWYKEWCQTLEKGESGQEDARFVLPNACETRMVVTMNARQLLHFFNLRCCNRAQWEIHQLADKMLQLCKQVAPVLFANAGPGCVSGPCPEGVKTCGQINKVREKYRKEETK